METQKNITIEEVQQAIANLTANKQVVTNNAIRAILGNRGSMATIHKFWKSLKKADEKEDSLTEEEIAEYVEITKKAKARGRAEKEKEIAEVRAELDEFVEDSKTKDVALLAAESKIKELENERTSLYAQILQSQQDLQAERATEKNHADEKARLLQKINDMQTAFVEKLDEANKKAHHFEIEFSKLQAIANLSKEVQGSGQYTTLKPAKK